MLDRQSDSLLAAFAEKQTRIFCVTRVAGHPLMWAHYGAGGAGICIGYAAALGNLSLFQPVAYLARFAGRRNLLEAAYLIKSRLWAYEEELRVVMPGSGAFEHNLAHPVRVGLGPRCSHRDMLRVKAVLPATVGDAFYMDLPWVEEGRLCFKGLPVEDLVQRYGHLPTLEEFYADNELHEIVRHLKADQADRATTE